MRRALRAVEQADAALDSVALDLEGRRKRRHVVETRKGETILVDLEVAPALRHGHGLVLEDGTVIRIEALVEPVLDITAPDLVRIAWHLGNRHLPTEIRPGALRIRADHVIAGMLAGLGAEIHACEAVFEPEGGAYGHNHHSHD